jgi:ABC-type transport system substrate-binding protein
MEHVPPKPKCLSIHRWSFFLAALCVGGWLALVSGQVAAPQTQKKPPLEEEDPNPRPLRKPPREDEGELVDLAHEVERATHPELQELYRRLAHPYDLVTRPNGNTEKVKPLTVYIGPGPGATGSVVMFPYDASWKLGRAVTVRRGDIESVEYYEQIALNQVDKFLKSQFDLPVVEAAKPLTQRERLEGAEKALAAVLNFHKPTPDRYARGSPAWKDLERRLREKLLDVRLEHLHLLLGANKWEEAFTRGDHLVRFEYRTDAKVHERITRELVELVAPALKKGKFAEVHQQLLRLEKMPGSGAVLEPIRKELQARAAQKFREAEQARDRNDPVKANTLINESERLWPRLSGVREFRWQLNKDHPTLGVGVRVLPEYFSPGTAVLDSEKQAVELLFDSLLKLHDDPGRGQTYEPSLAVAAPRRDPQGWQFKLDRTAYWSTGNPVTEADVRLTVRRLSDPRSAGFSPAWANLIETPTVGSDSSEVNLALRQGFIDPFSLMTFKVLPSSGSAIARPDDLVFGKNPVGSGPYQLVEARHLPGDMQGRQVVFVASSSYHRARKPEQPYIPEIRFFHSSDPIVDFKEGRLHLLLDLPPHGVEDLQKETSGLSNLVKVRAMKNRRIYFLAVNHRVPALQNEALRRAIAHSINRNQILDDVFRKGLAGWTQLPHRPLSGPYPPDSWAAEPTYRRDPYQPELVKRELLPKVKEALGEVKLTLKYPGGDGGDPLVKRACEMIQAQVRTTTGVELELEALPPRDLHREVTVQTNYDLAYFSYDYPSEAYWIWPLFNNIADPSRRNYLGYQNDGALDQDCQRSMIYREFGKVQEYTHSIHKQIYQKMPFIPLWQLDTFIAIHKDLTPTYIDPLWIFTDAAQWKLEKR